MRPPIAAEELAGLACEHEVESRLILQDGASEHWELQHGPFTDETFRTLPATHWTLLVQAVDHWVPEAATFLEQFYCIPSWRVDDLMMSYSSNGGGVGAHYDHYDVFLVQVSGRRRWEIGRRCNEHSPRRTDTPVMILSEWTSTQHWVLEPGDVLYVPPGVSHNGIAVGDDCMTCSVGFRAPSHKEILQGVADYIGETLNEDLRYTDPDLVPQANPGQITAGALEKAQHILRQYLNDKDRLAQWFGSFMTAPKYDENAMDLETYDLEFVRTHVSAGGCLIRNEGSRFAFQEHGAATWLFVDSRWYPCHEIQPDLVKILCAERTIRPTHYARTDAHLHLLVDLLNHGSLYLPD